MNGILLVDKPREWTSFDVVNRVRHMVQQSEFNTSNKKRFPTGHTGTLDPLATGLLVVLLGNYTKYATTLTKVDKTYEVTMKLGQTSTTGDEEGEKTDVSAMQPTQDQVETALKQFVGDTMQTPPIFSAIKVNGQRAYKLARKGDMPELKARPIHIESLQLTKYEYPFVRFTAEVSSGTYIRSLVEDLGKILQTCAYMSDLRRTKVGRFDIKDAVGMDGLTPEKITAVLRELDK
ncbi:MAG TPA: tRNA pseudouridine(55) synthase TruB [Candidatus Saccharimonadales bacterium]|nr:tRNA pseudouridine(55) synthase TruB [Candidatus Saccharimonadales bacterium]